MSLRFKSGDEVLLRVVIGKTESFLLSTVLDTEDPRGIHIKFVSPNEDDDAEDWVDANDLTLSSEADDKVTFKDRAATGLKYGIPVIPLRGKAPFTQDWPSTATIDPFQIEQWNTEYPDANCGMVAKSQPGGFWCLEVDSTDVGKRYKKDTGNSLPSNTLVIQSRPGRGHRWYRHNAASIAMGNLGQNDVLHKDFSVRAHNQQAVAPGSIHPESGVEYTLIRDVEPVEAPAELIAWLLKQKTSGADKPKNASTTNASAIAEAPIPAGSRNASLASLGGRWHHSGASDALVLEALLEANDNRCTPPLSVEEVKTIAKSVCRYDTSEDVQAGVILNGTVKPAPPSAINPNISLSYSDEMFYGLAGRIIKKLQPETESHPVGNLLELLTAYGNIVGPNPYYLIEDTKHFTNLFVVKVGKSSRSRKGTGKGRIERLAASVDALWFTERNTSGMGSGEVVVWDVRDEIIGPVKDKRTNVTRYEVTDPGVADKRLFISEGEFVGVLAVASRKDSLLSKIIRDAWDHKPLRNKTKANSAVCQDPHISITADITREELEIQLKEADKFNGFANRFLWCFVERQGLKPHGGEAIDWTVEIGDLLKAVEFGRSQKRIHMTRNARLMWERMYGELSVDVPGLCGAVTSRGEAQCIRLSLLFAMLDMSDHIDNQHLTAARALWQYCEDSARIIFGGITKEQQKELDFLSTGPKTLLDFTKTLFNGHKKKTELQLDLDNLVTVGKITRTVDGEKETYQLV